MIEGSTQFEKFFREKYFSSEEWKRKVQRRLDYIKKTGKAPYELKFHPCNGCKHADLDQGWCIIKAAKTKWFKKRNSGKQFNIGTCMDKRVWK